MPSCPQWPPDKEAGPWVPPELKREMDSRFLTSAGMGTLPPSSASDPRLSSGYTGLLYPSNNHACPSSYLTRTSSSPSFRSGSGRSPHPLSVSSPTFHSLTSFYQPTGFPSLSPARLGAPGEQGHMAVLLLAFSPALRVWPLIDAQ